MCPTGFLPLSALLSDLTANTHKESPNASVTPSPGGERVAALHVFRRLVVAVEVERESLRVALVGGGECEVDDARVETRRREVATHQRQVQLVRYLLVQLTA